MNDESEGRTAKERSDTDSPAAPGEAEQPQSRSSAEPRGAVGESPSPAGDAPLSAAQLGDAFSRMLGEDSNQGQPGHDGESSLGGADPSGDAAGAREMHKAPQPAEDQGEVTSRGILEAMLFVGNPDNRPLTPKRAAELIRDTEAADIRGLIEELNAEFESDNCPYRVVREGDGYRMVLGPEYHRLRDRFYGRVRRARLSRAAMEVLAIVAYNQPLTSEAVTQIRGTASGGVLAKLVRRQLLRIERPEQKPRKAHYRTTERFLTFFGLERLDDLPRSQELESR